MSKKSLFALIVFAATLTAAQALADTDQAPLTAETRGPAQQADPEDAPIRHMLAQFRAAQVPLSRAIAIAERLHDGSRTTDISFEATGSPIYRVRTLKNEQVWENVIDANTGGISDRERATSLKELDREDLANFIAMKRVKQELTEAVQVAEKATEGRALAGGLIKQAGRLNFVVLVANGDGLKEVMLEPPTSLASGSTRH